MLSVHSGSSLCIPPSQLPARRLSSGAPRQPRRHSYRQSPTPSSPLGPAPQNPEAGGAPRELRVSDLGGGGLWLLGRAPPQPATPAELLLCSRGCHPLPAACLRSALTGAKSHLGWRERDAGVATAGEGQALESRSVGV